MRIGIVVPAYNAAPWIGDAIASVIGQTHRDWTLVVVDDGSTDGTAHVVAGFGDPRIRLVRQANAGVSAARNRGVAELWGTDPAPQPPPQRGGGVDNRGGGIDNASTSLPLPSLLPLPSGEGVGGRGDALLFLDADDWLAPDALFRLAAALDASPDAVAATGACAFVGSGDTLMPPSGDILERLLVRNLFANGGHFLLRRGAVQVAGGFLPGLAYGEDWEFCIRIALLGPFVATCEPKPVLFVRQHPGGAYQRLASDPAAFVPCMEAIFGNPDLLARFGPRRLAAIRRRTDAENHWIIGRELIRHGRQAEGRAWLRRSVRAALTLKRAALLAAAHALPLLPTVLRGPFRPYRLAPQTALRSPGKADVHRPGDRPGLPRNAKP
jgi:glycosyltransferase involved in cell wall biosynthesis